MRLPDFNDPDLFDTAEQRDLLEVLLRRIHEDSMALRLIETDVRRIENMVQDDRNAEFFGYPLAGSLKIRTAADTLELLLRKHHSRRQRHDRPYTNTP